MFFVSMPNAATSFAAVETATKCLATAASAAAFLRPAFWASAMNQALAASALDIVSCVVKVLDAMMNKVSFAFTARSVSARCVESTLETKKNFMLRFV